MSDLFDAAVGLGWGVVYAVPWLGAFVVTRWTWRRVRPWSLFVACAASTALGMASLVVLSMALVSLIDAAAGR